MTDELPAIVMQHLLTAGLQAAVLVVLVGLTLLVLGRRIAPRWRHRLWWLVALRLALPVLPASAISIYQWLPDAIATSHTATDTPTQNEAVAATSIGPTATPSPPVRSLEGPAYSPDPEATEPARETTGQTRLAPPIRPSPASAAPAAAADAEGPGPTPTVAEEPSTTGTTPRGAIHRFAPAAFILWLAVATLLLTRTAIGWMVLTRRIRRDAATPSPRALRLLDEETHALRLNRPPALRTTSAVTGPTLIGAFRPTLLLPPGLAEVLDELALRLVFRHELCHLRSRDNFANWLLAFLQAMHWYNPAAWWALAQLRTQREHARDADTLRSRPEDQHIDRTRTYADALLAVVRFGVGQSPQAPRPHPAASAAVRDRRYLSRRLAMLEHANRFRLPHSLLACALLLILGVTGLTVAQGQNANAHAALADEPTAQVAQSADATDAQQALDVADAPVEADAALRIARQIVALEWDNISFEDAIADLEQQIGLRITFDPVIQEAIDEFDPSQPHLSTTLARMPLESALRLALDLLPGERLHTVTPPVDANWTLEDGTLHLGLETGEIRVYDIRDLLVIMQPDPAEAPWADEKIEEVRQEYLQQAANLFKETIGQPRHWSNEYADTDFSGTIQELNGNLIVKTTPTNHRDILSLLERLRETRGWMISFEVKLLLLDDATFQAVFSEDIQVDRWGGSRFHSVHPGRRGAQAPGDAEAAINPQRSDLFYGFVGGAFPNEDQVASLLEHASEPGRRNLVFDIPRITAFNGQPAYAVHQNQRPYIAGYDEVSKEGIPPHAAIEPVLSVSEVGALLLLRGTVSSDRDFVTLTTVVEVAAEFGVPLQLSAPQAEGTEPGYIELPQIDYRKMQTTLSMEDQLWMLGVGPMVRGKINDDDPAEHTDTRRVVLLVKPTIIELQEQEMTVEELEALRERSEAAGSDEPATEGDPLGD